MTEAKHIRNTNLDVLRCFAMFAIVLCHAYQHNTSIVLATPSRDMVFLLLLRWHVNVFVGLSGWFGITFSLKKFCKIWGLMAFYSVISILVGRFALGVPTPLRIDGGWFANAYLCLMLISPIINAAIENLVAKGSKPAWLAWGGFATMMLFNWISRNCYFGILAWDVFSHSLVQMVFVYFTVRLFRLTGIVNHVKLWHVVAVTLIFVAGCIVLGKSRTDYIAPYTVAMAIALLVAFDKFIRFPQWLSRICASVAPLMFGVYLMHEATSFGKMFHMMPVKRMINVGVNPGLAICWGALICFAICMTLEALRRLIANIFIKYSGLRRNVV